MLTFYPEFEADNIIENEIIFLLDLSNSMKVQSICQSVPSATCRHGDRSVSFLLKLFPWKLILHDELLVHLIVWIHGKVMLALAL